MTPQRFVQLLRENVIDDEVQFYGETLESSPAVEVTDKYWIDLLHFYNGLDSSQRLLLLQLVRQISVDTLASLLAIIDGSSKLDDAIARINLTVNGNIELAGELQEQFFIQEHQEKEI